MALSPRSLTRAALAGLVLGLAGGAFVFVWSAWHTATKECAFPGTEECNFELANAREIARLQSFAAIGCILVAGGLYLAVRRR